MTGPPCFRVPHTPVSETTYAAERGKEMGQAQLDMWPPYSRTLSDLLPGQAKGVPTLCKVTAHTSSLHLILQLSTSERTSSSW